MSEELTLYDKLLIAEEVIEIMITMKKDQIRDEPNESIWKKQLEQYHIMLGDIMGEKESWFDEDIDKKESDNRRQSEARLEQKDYDLDNQEINQTVKKVNTFIDKYSDKHMKKWNKYYPQKEVTS